MISIVCAVLCAHASRRAARAGDAFSFLTYAVYDGPRTCVVLVGLLCCNAADDHWYPGCIQKLLYTGTVWIAFGKIAFVVIMLVNTS